MTTSQLQDPSALVVAVYVVWAVAIVATAVAVFTMDREWKRQNAAEEWDATAIRRASRRMLITMGFFMVCTGLVLATMGSIANMISVTGMGILMIVGAAYGVFTGELWERQRPDRHSDDD